MTIDETKYNNFFINKFKADATQLGSEFKRTIDEHGYSETTKLDFYKAVFEKLITQFKNEVTKDENYDYIITTLYTLFIRILKEDNIDTTKFEADLTKFKKIELAKIKTSPKISPQAYAPIYRTYNLNTKYGRRKAREQAIRNYENGTPEYKEEIDNIKAVVWLIIIVISIICFFIKLSAH